MKSKKGSRGITLIALVITIIVLLILAAVSIATLTGENGILTKANTAKEKTEIERIKEEARTSILGVQTENKGSITETEVKEILEKYGTLNGEVKEEGTTLTSKEGYVILVSEILNGLKFGGNSKTLADFEVGDYVIYDSGAQGEIKCRVLYNQSSEYGLQIISNQSLEEIGLGDTSGLDDDGCKALIDELEEATEKYFNSSYANSIRCVGTHPINGPDYEFNSETYKTDLNQLVNNNLNIATADYWISSAVKEGDWSTVYCIRKVLSDGTDGKEDLCVLTGYGTIAQSEIRTNGFRPCITLKEELKVVSGDGKSEKTAYRISN